MNKKQSRGTGYTIIEVMIFLAVSTALFFATMATLAGQQRRQEFYQAAREADSRIQDVINDFSTGYFPDLSSFGCTADSSGGAPVPNTTASEQGTREGCAFIGKVIHFAPSGTNSEGYRVVTVVGRQFKGAPLSEVVENIVEARPVPLEAATLVEQSTFGYGLRVGKMTYTDSGGIEQPVGAIGFFSSFADVDEGSTLSGKQTTQTIISPGTAINQSSSSVNAAISSIGASSWTTFKPSYVSRPVTICLVGSANQHGLIRLGDNNRQVATTLTIGGGNTCP